MDSIKPSPFLAFAGALRKQMIEQGPGRQGSKVSTTIQGQRTSNLLTNRNGVVSVNKMQADW